MKDEKVAIVSGGNRGIGLEICRSLIRNGVKTVLCSRDLSAGEHAARELLLNGEFAYVRQLEVNDDASVDNLAEWVEKEFGRLDILVNNAAILIDRVPRAIDLDAGTLLKVLDTNLAGPLRLTRALAPLLRKSSAGRIVNMSSALGQVGFSGSDRPSYRLSKLALNGLTRMFAEEFAVDHIKVNAASPGLVRTRMGGESAPRNVAEGADTPVWLALLPADGPTGGLFKDRTLQPW